MLTCLHTVHWVLGPSYFHNAPCRLPCIASWRQDTSRVAFGTKSAGRGIVLNLCPWVLGDSSRVAPAGWDISTHLNGWLYCIVGVDRHQGLYSFELLIFEARPMGWNAVCCETIGWGEENFSAGEGCRWVWSFACYHWIAWCLKTLVVTM